MFNEITIEAVMKSENLEEAYRSVKRNGGKPGVDGMSTVDLKAHFQKYRETICSKVLEGTYQPAAIKEQKIPKDNGGIRTLGIPTVLDRTIQKAINLVIEPIFEGGFSDTSYGFRPNRGAHDALRKAQEYVLAGKRWVVDIDLKSFFDQVNHDRLMTMIGRKVRDKKILALIAKYLKAPMQKGDGTKEKRNEGTPQGGPLSPLLANIYLDPLDKELEKRGLSFVRYADDIAIYVSSQRSAERILESLVKWIKKELKLEVNLEKSKTGPVRESALLGFRLNDAGRIGISPKALSKLEEEVRELWEARRNMTSQDLRTAWRQYIIGWWNYFKLADRRHVLVALGSWIRRHMRKCFWLRWHNRKGRKNALKRLGIKGRSLDLSSSSRGAWRIARSLIMHTALSKKTLNQYGYIMPWELAEAVK